MAISKVKLKDLQTTNQPEAGKFLSGDGVWKEVEGGGGTPGNAGSHLAEQLFMLGEDVEKNDSLFVESVFLGGGGADSDIGSSNGNKKIALKLFLKKGTLNDLKIKFKKYGSPVFNLQYRLETNNFTVPSGNLYKPDAWGEIDNCTNTYQTFTLDFQDDIEIDEDFVILWLVIYQGTGSLEVVDGNNFYQMERTSRNTTTRPILSFNGTDWGQPIVISNNLNDNTFRSYAGNLTQYTPSIVKGDSASLTVNSLKPMAADYYMTRNLIGSSNTTSSTPISDGYFWIDDNNYFKMRVEPPRGWVDYIGTMKYNLEIKKDGNIIYSEQIVVPNLSYYLIDTHQIKLIREGNKYSFYYWYDGSWVLIDQIHTIEFSGDIYFKGYANRYGSGNQQTFSNVYISNTNFSTKYPVLGDGFLYSISASCLIDGLLSKTDATYNYKLPQDGKIRLSQQAITSGNIPALTYLGEHNGFEDLEVGNTCYIQNVPGTIGIQPGTNPYYIGDAVNNNTIIIRNLPNKLPNKYLGQYSVGGGENEGTLVFEVSYTRYAVVSAFVYAANGSNSYAILENVDIDTTIIEFGRLQNELTEKRFTILPKGRYRIKARSNTYHGSNYITVKFMS